MVEVLVLLAAAVLLVPLSKRLGLGSVLGYLMAGVLVGPWGLGLIDRLEEIRHIAEFGVVFLLFIIGIESKPARLWVMRRTVFGLGTAQVMVTGLLFTGLALLFKLDARTAVIVGFGLALSSTAFGLQFLTERGELGTHSGRAAFSILLLQDLAVVPLLTLVSLLAQPVSLVEGLEFALLDTVLVVVAVLLFGRFLLSPLLHHVATSRNSEVFTAAAVLVVLGTAWLMDAVGLSMALGAFLAGMMLADSHFRHQIIADIQPFRGSLLGLFFMAVGMSINFGLLTERVLLVIVLVAGLLCLKAVVLWGLCRVAKIEREHSLRVSLLLAQSGEFGFVIFALAVAEGVMVMELFQMLTLIIALSMALTPLLVRVHLRFEGELSGAQHVHPNHIKHASMVSAEHYVVLAGFGRMGRNVAKVLAAREIPYLAVDSDPDCVARARAEGFEVFYGDASQAAVLHAAGAERAEMLVVTLDKPEVTGRLVKIMHQHYPETPIYTRARDQAHVEQLYGLGAHYVVSETREAGFQLGGAILRANGIAGEEVDHLLGDLRNTYYDKLRDSSDSES